jgi:hypothetical protein
MVKTDIGRHIASRSWFHELIVFLTLLITAKTADLGARICVTAALKPKENHVSGGLLMVAARPAPLTAHARMHACSALDSQLVCFASSIELLLMMCVLGRVLQLLADGRPVPPVCHDTEASLPC